MKKIFRSSVCRWLFARLHPNFAMWLGKKWSKNNRLINGKQEEEFLGEEKEWLILFCREKLKTEKFDFFIYIYNHVSIFP